MSVSEKVLDAIELLATNSIDKAGYDRTIQAQIVSCEDATIGKYRCRYQDAIIYAYANNSDMTFNNGAYVYILVPGNDMRKEKTILGTTKKLGINYISQAQGDQAYDIIGNNCVTSDNKFYLDSSIKDYKYKIYPSNDVTLNIEGLEQYIKQSSSIILGAKFKTSIPPERQYVGHYGITYNLKFIDNMGGQVVRSYTIDEDNMVDNPYRLAYETRQYQIFDVDGPNFVQVESIEIFCKDFPGAEGASDQLLSSGDIEITVLEISGAVRMSENELGGVAITFYTPQGTFFTSDSTSASYKVITAQVRIKGKLASAAQRIPFYWGSENVGIVSGNGYYNKYLGRGWKCLNDKNVIQNNGENQNDMSNAIIEWIPGKDTYILKFEDATARDNKFKVAIVYDGNVITKTINIQNLAASVPQLTIESSDGTKFYYDIGHPTLTCKVNGGELSDYTYAWAYESNTGMFNELPPTDAENTKYGKDIDALNTLKTKIANGEAFANAQAKNLTSLEQAVAAYDLIQRVQGNKIYDVQIRNITSFGTFKCSVHNGDIYLGTASITLTNTLEGEDIYSLVINNGSAVYQYNENGVAPNSKSLDTQQQIQGLSFTIYDNLGQPIDSKIIQNSRDCKIRWQFPIKDSMLQDQNNGNENDGTDATQTYRYYDNKINLNYGIAQRYDIKKQNNQIKLTVDYKGMNLTAETNFTFAKQGEPGTNGTEYIVKLIPNTTMNNPPLWPMITTRGNSHSVNYSVGTNLANETTFNTGDKKQLLKAQLWHSGELVWEGFSANENHLDDLTMVHWQILKNKYNSFKSDESAFKIEDEDASSGYIKYMGNNFDKPLANIIKCSIVWQGKTYYGTMPIITAWVNNKIKKVNNRNEEYYASFKLGLKDFTGFRYVMYTSDGMTPQYDNSHPFEFICQEQIEDVWEDISTVSGDHQVFCRSEAIGNYYPMNADTNTEPIKSNLLEPLNSQVYTKDLAKNQFRFRPASRYDGVCVNETVYCEYTQNEKIIGKIHVPIHFLLNKYGLANINEWDGNSVQIDDEGGFILSPQMGAGHKNSENQFTGVLMGEVRTPGKNNADIGLLGYHNGDRSFFLNSENGSAIFGKANQGQITIDPSTNNAMLYSGNFWLNYNQNGLPTNYNKNNEREQGLLIDLTTPEIRYGNGKFYVNDQGHIHAAGGGDIAGWKITDTDLYSNVSEKEGRITLSSKIEYDNEGNLISSGKIYSHQHKTLDTADTGFYLAQDGLSIGKKVKITNDGVMYLGAGAVKHKEGQKCWTIDGSGNNSYIAYGTDSWKKGDRDNGDRDLIYLGTNGFSLGQSFSVTPKGELTAYRGKIGGWDITKTKLSAGKIELDASDGSMKGGSSFPWSISSSGEANFNNINANNSGSIGGWSIGSTYLRGGSLTLHNSGAIDGGTWSIDSNGVANFTNSVSMNGCSISSLGLGSGSVGGSLSPSGGGSIGGGAMGITSGGGYVNPRVVTDGDGSGTTLEGHFNRLYATIADINELNVLDKLSYLGHQAYWHPMVLDVSSFSLVYGANNTITGVTAHVSRKYAIVCDASVH